MAAAACSSCRLTRALERSPAAHALRHGPGGDQHRCRATLGRSAIWSTQVPSTSRFSPRPSSVNRALPILTTQRRVCGSGCARDPLAYSHNGLFTFPAGPRAVPPRPPQRPPRAPACAGRHAPHQGRHQARRCLLRTGRRSRTPAPPSQGFRGYGRGAPRIAALEQIDLVQHQPALTPHQILPELLQLLLYSAHLVAPDPPPRRAAPCPPGAAATGCGQVLEEADAQTGPSAAPSMTPGYRR